jgi:hypothetical protein
MVEATTGQRLPNTSASGAVLLLHEHEGPCSRLPLTSSGRQHGRVISDLAWRSRTAAPRRLNSGLERPALLLGSAC